jgi:Ala-tRNA(Pro) deacylase
MILSKLREYLDTNKIKYTVISHSPAFTAQEIAAIAHIPGKELAKTVVMKVDGKPTLAVVPATDMVDFRLLKRAYGANEVSLANEIELNKLFPECEVGAMPPFGNLFNLDVAVAEDLVDDDEIAFNAGTHRELVKMSYKDFHRLVQPKIAKIGVHKKAPIEDRWGYEG